MAKKMNYEEFKTKTEKEIMDYMPEGSPWVKVVPQKKTKVNTEYDSLVFMDGEEATPYKPCPVVYIDIMYDNYIETDTEFSEIMKEVCEKVSQPINCNIPKISKDVILENVFIELINTEQNEELLKGVPHRSMLDLSIIYRWNVCNNENESATTIIVTELMDKIGVTEDELYSAAIKNMTNNKSSEIMRIKDVVLEMMSPELFDVNELTGIEFADDNMWVCTNKAKLYGAGCILLKDNLNEFCDKIGCDTITIVPSSIHEVLLMKANEVDFDYLRQLVKEVNDEQVFPEERLSYNVYVYEKESGKLKIA